MTIKEFEIRPQEIFDQYLALSAADAKALLNASNQFIDVVCPACQAKERKHLFDKNGFSIQECAGCFSLYCSPRPSPEQLKHFYVNSPSSNFWMNNFFPAVADVRREKLFRPKAQQIAALLKSKKVAAQDVCDIGAGFGLLLDELKPLLPQAKFYAVEPGEKSASVCEAKGYAVLRQTVENAKDWNEKFDFVTCLEVIEHVFDAQAFIKAMFNLLKPGGCVLITGQCGDGFDIQVLGPLSKSIFPPHHLNFLSVKGLEILFKKAGYENIDITTPGVLDVDIVKNTYAQTKAEAPAFIKTLLNRDEGTLKRLQNFLVENRLSSHVWIFAQKPL